MVCDESAYIVDPLKIGEKNLNNRVNILFELFKMVVNNLIALKAFKRSSINEVQATPEIV